MAAASGPIAIEAAKTRRHLQELLSEIVDRQRSETFPEGVNADPGYITDCLGRFNIWVGSLGVFQIGEASLDYRISDSSLSEEVLRLLKQLDGFTVELEALVNGSQEQRIWTRLSLQMSRAEFSDSDDSSDDDTEAPLTPTSGHDSGEDSGVVTESRELCLLINEAVTSLLRLSIQLHKSSRRAKFARSSASEDYPIEPDVSHIRDFFPRASSNEMLVEKLGKANAQRRQWLWYRRRHREKLSVDLSGPQEQRLPWFRDAERSTVGPVAMVTVDDHPIVPLPSLSGTHATTFRSRRTATLDMASQSAAETLFDRSSRATWDEEKLLVPETPKNLIPGEPFQCRYCCNIIELTSRLVWQKHVHTDLSSYTCVFANCSEMFFESRRKWWAHEMSVHRKKWTCAICGIKSQTLSDMSLHLRSVHSDQIPSQQIDDVAHSFGRPLTHIPANDCPLCDYPSLLKRRGYSDQEVALVPAEKFCRHVGRHLEQLALFVLPNTDLIYDDEDISEGNVNDQGQELSSGDEDDDHPGQLISEPDLVQKLFDETAVKYTDPEIHQSPPDLAMRWQPPHDFSPPEEDFDTEDADLFPMRQEPIFGGDLHTPGWARGVGSHKEGFCARCPVSHWVTIPDGSYSFHLTYFHGVPDSGVPLPRPSTIRPVKNEAGIWEGFCDACQMWRVLKKTKRGWNWYRHWMQDHEHIIDERTHSIRHGNAVNDHQLQPVKVPSGVDPRFKLHDLIRADRASEVEAILQRELKLLSPKELQQFVNARPETGESLLMLSASQGQEQVVDLLLQKGADFNSVDARERTALDFAVDAGYFAIARKLIEAGADTSKATLFKKVFSNEREYAGEMTRKPQRSIQALAKIDVAKLRPLGRAAFEGNAVTVSKLLVCDDGSSTGVDVEEDAGSGHTAFLLASMADHQATRLDVMELLLQYGTNINATSKHGWTALMLAAKRDDASMVDLLIRQGADVNHLSPDRWTALAEATTRGSSRIVRLLLDEGADTELKSQHDWTPLMHAAYQGDTYIFELLLEAGAAFDGISNRDETPMLLAAAAGSTTVVRLLLARGCPPESVWSSKERVAHSHEWERMGPPEPDAEILSHIQQLRIERTYKVGWTPLMVACQVGNLEIVTLLLDAGANLEARSPMFKTPLEIARENGRLDIAEHLEKRIGQ